MARSPKITRAKRDARAKKAKAIINTAIPALLKANARARRGVDGAELILDPPPAKAEATRLGESEGTGAAPTEGDGSDGREKEPRVNIRVAVTTTLAAAAQLLSSSGDKTNGNSSSKSSSRKGGNGGRVGILNMASPLRPGGGVLSGATSQEEWLCSRTTLYPSLRDEWYRLPEVGGVYTPDVLVFGRWDAEVGALLDRREQFFVDVVTAGMLRFPDVVDNSPPPPPTPSTPSDDEGRTREPARRRQGRRRYAEDKDRELVLRKMRAVLRIFRAKGVDKLVLGAWGCGAYANPVGEVARAWGRALLGSGGTGRRPRPRKSTRTAGAVMTGAEGWAGLEVVFAIKDRAMATEFAEHLGPEVMVEEDDAAAPGQREGELETSDGDEVDTESDGSS